MGSKQTDVKQTDVKRMQRVTRVGDILVVTNTTVTVTQRTLSAHMKFADLLAAVTVEGDEFGLNSDGFVHLDVVGYEFEAYFGPKEDINKAKLKLVQRAVAALTKLDVEVT